ncbi:cytochrome P450 [Variovorax sp. KK3]|uniref:cytochrome P450 n=1 Tax=Variovorax sp. KK3 TaxID=1855728 RepID=UPI00097C39DA|nr:cytochrome P450 [Variovorax sp. KK3]
MAITSDEPRADKPARRISELPGPRGLPLLGNALQIERERLHRQVEQWAHEYGEMYRFRIASREFVVISNPATVAGVLRDRPDGFQRGAKLNAAARSLGFNGLFTVNGDEWRRHRPMVLRGLDPTHIKAFHPTLVRVTERFANRWRRAAEAAQPIDLQADLMRYTVDVTAGLAFGTDINTIESDEEVIQTHLDKLLPALAKRVLSPLPRWLTRRDPAVAEGLAAVHEAVSGFIAAARRRLADEPGLREQPRNLIEAMVAERDRPGSDLSDEDLSGNMLTMLLAGEDTTANTLAWMIWLLHRHPEAAQRAAEEVHRVLGAEAHPTHEQLAQLDFVEACAHETMRLKPVAPLLIQEAVRDTVVDGVEVPAGTPVMCLMRPGAVSAANFADPQAFRPERWLAGDGPGRAAGSAKRVAMPFGAGPRTCPGRYLALSEIKMVAAMLLRHFDIVDVAGPGGMEVQERLAFTMSPVGLKMRLRARS